MHKEDDPHRWLEAIDDPQALAWVEAQNEVTLKALGTPAQRALEARLLSIFESEDRIPYVAKRGAYLYNFWQDAQHVRGLWRRTTLEQYRSAEPHWETMLDLDALAEAEGESWVFAGATWLKPSYDRVMLALSRGGSDAVTLREYDVQTKRFIDDGFFLPEAKSFVSWKDRDTLYVGTDFGPGSLTNSGYPRIAKEWRRGTPLSAAKTLFSGEEDDVFVGVNRDHHQGRFIDVIRRRTGFFSSEVHVFTTGGTERIDRPADAEVSFFQDRILFRPRTAWQPASDQPQWPPGSLLSAPLSAYLQGERSLQPVFIPKKNQSLRDLSATAHGLLLNVLEDVRSRLLVARVTDGRWALSDLPTAEFATTTVQAFDSDQSDQYWLSSSGYLTPSTLSLGSLDGGAATVLRRSKAYFEATGLEVTQHFASSKDGTRVPYFQVAKAGLPLSGDHPTLLSGYGGFEIARTPTYSASVGAAWLERGGVFVEANIRGGGEYGPSWHAAARKAHRQRAYDDFIAVAEDLIARGVTRPARLGIRGGSNGGLLVGVMLTQRPDLWGAVVCLVPLLDMQRYHRLLAGASWMAEYGNPDVEADWATLAAYSPYHHVRPDAHYPRTFFATSTRDDRVHPGHARKMVARMQSQQHPTLYFENMEGGHAGATNAKQLAHRSSLEFTYLAQQLRNDEQR